MGIMANLDVRRGQGKPFEGCGNYGHGRLAQESAGSNRLGPFQEEGKIPAKALRQEETWCI